MTFDATINPVAYKDRDSDSDITMIEMMRSIEKQTKYESCVLCGQQMNVPVDVPIKDREHYIDSVGQLCQKCFLRLM